MQERDMKFLLLVCHGNPANLGYSDADCGSMLVESVQLTHTLHAHGQYIHASPLTPTAQAARVAVRNGKASVTDGPFAETHEQVAGYFFIEAASRDEAIDIARRIPGARLGHVEVREVREIDGLPGESRV
jgi:hypothetical protein